MIHRMNRTHRMDDQLPIGRFARSCRLSIKALRHYDELGLLRPAFVDPETGYRYYRRDQARTAMAIAMLRSLGVPLGSIRDVLRAESPDALKSVLGGERRRLERELSRGRHALLTIERVMRSGALMPYSITVREEPARLVMKLAGTLREEHLVEDSTALTHRLMDLLAEAGIPRSGPVLCLIPQLPGEGPFDIEAGVALETPYPAVGDAVLERLAGGPCAVLTHMGPYESLSLAYYAMFAWVHEHGYTEAGVLREYYLNDPQKVPAEEILTEVVLPIATLPSR